MKYFYIPLLTILITVYTNSFSQENSVKPDSLHLKPDISIRLSNKTESQESNQLPLRLPRLNPAENFLPQYTPYQRLTLSPLNINNNINISPIQWHGVASDFINTKSRTAIASTNVIPNLLLHSSATLGMVETPFFGKGYYYLLNAGARYSINPSLVVGISGAFNSNFDVIPYWNIGIEGGYQVSRDLMFDGGLTYLKTGENMFNLAQSAIMLDLHGRYRITDKWYFNVYGGMPIQQKSEQIYQPMLPMMNTPYFGASVEYWFNPYVGVEGGMIWSRDIFSGNIQPQAKVGLLIRPAK